jgi:hypothetical protein
MALLFWGLAAGTCYVIFRHLASGIPWSDVAAVVTDRAGEREAGNSAAGLASRDDMPPVAQVSAGPGGSTGTPAAREESIWGEPDANGYSVLSARGSSAPRGVVKGSRVRLRAEPNTASKILGHFDDGRVCEVTRRYWSGREKYHWFMVISGQDSGWMYGEYLKMTED